MGVFTMGNHGLYALLNAATTGSTDIRALVFKTTTPSVAAIRDMDFVSDLLGATTEAAASGYARIDLASVAVTESDASDNVVISAAAPTTAAIAAGETWLGIGYYIEGASDAARILIGVDVPTASQVTNGGTITLPALTVTVTGS